MYQRVDSAAIIAGSTSNRRHLPHLLQPQPCAPIEKISPTASIDGAFARTFARSARLETSMTNLCVTVVSGLRTCPNMSLHTFFS